MENLTSIVPKEWEYYYDYVDPVIVDQRKLKYNKCKYFFLSLYFYNGILWWQKQIFSFILRFYRDNILDYFGCICGIPLFHFEPDVLGWNIPSVSDTCIDRNRG